jgi:hypothetical protein
MVLQMTALLRPAHRCKQETFASILVHGNCISLCHMLGLKDVRNAKRQLQAHPEIDSFTNEICKATQDSTKAPIYRNYVTPSPPVVLTNRASFYACIRFNLPP